MHLFSWKKAVSKIGFMFIIIGMSLIVFWGLQSSHINLSSYLPKSWELAVTTSTLLPPSPTATPDFLVPTRTPTGDATNPDPTSENVTLSPTPTRFTTRTVTPTQVLTPEIPTATNTTIPPTPEEPATLAATPLPPDSPTPTETTVAVLPTGNFQIPKEDIFRLGVSLPHRAIQPYGLETLGAGWVMDWSTRLNPNIPAGIEFVQSVSTRFGYLSPDAATLTKVAAARQGSTWLISNEPDVVWQDNITSDTYARLYHEAYTAIKSGDSSAVVVAGGIAQPTPLRFTYLEMMLAEYQSLYGTPMPVQAWHIHNYMLREERGGWGIDIPPGLSANTGVLYGVDDSGNMDAFKSQIYAFRQWMANNGYGGLPLIVSEYGIPMPPDYGFDLERVSGFFRDAWYFFYTAKDPSIGNPADEGRLVQRWCWFSLGSEGYPAGNILNPPAGDWTRLADVWRGMVEP